MSKHCLFLHSVQRLNWLFLPGIFLGEKLGWQLFPGFLRSSNSKTKPPTVSVGGSTSVQGECQELFLPILDFIYQSTVQTNIAAKICPSWTQLSCKYSGYHRQRNFCPSPSLCPPSSSSPSWGTWPAPHHCQSQCHLRDQHSWSTGWGFFLSSLTM